MPYPWSSALVTGASSGIGAAMARQLGTAGTDVVLVARRTERLEELADELRSERPDGSRASAVEIIAADLTDEADLAAVAIRAGSTDQPIDLLVNCAGLGASGPFADGDLARYTQIIDLNIAALVTLTHAAVPAMRDRGRGWVLNVSSLGGHAPGPSFAVYSASKAFVTSFSESLHEELRRSGVVVTAVCPGPPARSSPIWPTSSPPSCPASCCRTPMRWPSRGWPPSPPDGPCGSPAGSTGPRRPPPRCSPARPTAASPPW